MVNRRVICPTLALLWMPLSVGGQQAPAAGSVYTIPIAISGAAGESLTAEEGLVFVPKNRAKPGSRIISVHFIRMRGTAPGTRPPIFLLPGGPGGFFGREGLAAGPVAREPPRRLAVTR